MSSPLQEHEEEPLRTIETTTVVNEETSSSEADAVDCSWVTFFKTFITSKGAPQIIAIGLLSSLGIGATIGVVPRVVSDRYARTRYGYGGRDCSLFDRAEKPDACQLGADAAQSSAAIASLVMNLLTLCSNSTVGSISDCRGRKGIMVLSTFLSTLSLFVLVLMQLSPSIDPVWYYVAYAPIGLVNGMSIVFAMLSDLMPPKYRAHSFGLYLAAFYVGISFGPSFARVLDHFWVSLLSLSLLVLAFLTAIFALPETLPKHIADRNLEARRSGDTYHDEHALAYSALRPLREAAILNRDSFLRLLTVGAFFSGIVYSTDASLVLYYIEDQLDVRDDDLATMLLVMGLIGVAFQGYLLKFLISCMGEKGLLVASFASGTLHNLLYGLAKTKGTIYIALGLSQFTKTNFPLIPSMASKMVNESEQGRIQGALFAVSALANAIGPVSLEWVYSRTKDGAMLGPGTMFVVGAALYGIGTLVVCLVPSKVEITDVTVDDTERDMEEPLLSNRSLDST